MSFDALVRPALTGPERAAALLYAMGKEAAGRLLKHFEPDELRVLTQAAAALGPVSAPVVEDLAADLAASLQAGPDIRGSDAEAKALLSGAFTPDEVAGLLGEEKPEAPVSVWDRLPGLPDPALVEWLGAEHPQAAASFLGKLDPERTARLFGLMPAHLRNELARRMLGTRPPMPTGAAALDAVLAEDVLPRAAAKTGPEKPTRLAGVLNKMEPAQMDALLSELMAQRPKEAEVLRGLLFSFDDVTGLSQQARLVLFDQVATEKVVLALKGAQAECREAVLSALSARARRIVEAELGRDDGAAPRDVAGAQRAIADLALSLAERGLIELPNTEAA